MTSPTFAFDLDGTLIDSAPDLLGTLNVVLGEAGLAPVSAAEANGLFGGGARVLIERGLALHRVRLSPAAVDKMFEDFLAHYEQHLADQSRPFPGAIEALDALAATGGRLVIVTNKLERFAVKLMQELGLAERFALIAGADTFAARKPDPAHLLGAIAKVGGRSTQAVMIGDSETDVTAARRANVPVVAVTWGYSAVPARELAADRVVERFADVPQAAQALLATVGARA
jgi:phosphoglycolate phosphatase